MWSEEKFKKKIEVIVKQLVSVGSGYPIPGIPEPDQKYFALPEPV